MTPSEFTKECAKEFRAAPTVLNVMIVEDLQLKVTSKESTTADVFLQNAYVSYKLEPKEMKSIIQNFVHTLLESVFDDEHAIAKDKILPVIRHKELLQNAKYVHENYNGELVLLYAEDLPNGIQFITEEALEKSNIQVKDLRAIALANLEPLFDKIEIHGENGLYMLTAGGSYETSLLLLDRLWSHSKLSVKGDFVIGVPNRDILVATGSNDEEGISKAKSIAEKSYRELSYPVSSRLFIYRDGKFEVYDG